MLHMVKISIVFYVRSKGIQNSNGSFNYCSEFIKQNQATIRTWRIREYQPSCSSVHRLPHSLAI